MSAALHPNYFSKSAEANRYIVCSCGKRALKDSLRMKNGKSVCPHCKGESK